MAKDLRDAGVSRLNISLDTLDEAKYAHITRVGKLEEAIRGVEAAVEAGFDKIKINAVLIGGFNDNEIAELAQLSKVYSADVRFIELMPMTNNEEFGQQAYVTGAKVLETLPQLCALPHDGGVAKLYRLPDAAGNIGLINPVSSHFCATCNRIRLTADGKLKPCLHSNQEYNIKGLDFAGMRNEIERAIIDKPACHAPLSAYERSDAHRNMNEIGG